MEERELPAGWEIITLSEAATWGSGGTPSRKNPEYYGGTIPWVKTGELGPRILIETEETISELGLVNSSAKLFPAGSIAVAMYGATIGKVSMLGVAAATNQACAVAVADSFAVHTEFLFHYLCSQRDEFANAGKGGAQPNISQGLIKGWLFPLAPLNEQRRIAAKLDTTLAAVEACRQRLDGVAAILKRFRQAVLAAATSGELTREWREERGLKVAPTISLGEIIKVSSGRFLPAKAMVACGGIPVYGGNGVNGLHNESNVSQPTLVIGRVGYYCGSIHLTPEKAWVTDNALVVRHDATSTRSKYLYYALQGIDLRANDSSTAQPVISGAKIYPLKLMCPCIEEQDEIIDRIESLFTLADQLEARLTAARKVVDRLTPAVLAKAFRGELVPQDPNDEPASVLLERLAATRRAARQAEAGAGKPSRRGRPKAAANPDQLPLDAAPVSPDFLAGLLRECGALSERALLAVSELEPQRFEQQLFLELERGTAREVQADGQVLLEAVG
ncbi:MAG: restriction endonuclease subunit S [Synechococcaceae cyanobacterium]